jgi:5-methyltetrahydropteroyltriglutamate--homocysteine methyltransferase
LEPAARAAVDDVVKRQLETGIDLLNDGEMAKPDFATYVTSRLTGFADDGVPRAANLEQLAFPEYFGDLGGEAVLVKACVGPITWAGDERVQRDIDDLRAALGQLPPERAFMSAASPGVVWYYQPDQHYGSHEEYVFAIADAMKHEYDAIHAAGFTLQLDCPDLAGGWGRPEFMDETVDAFRRVAAVHVEALNHATRDIPPEAMRMHVCWGNIEGPHTRDVALREIVDVLLTARPAGLSFEGANPRHEHEWRLWRDVSLPEEKYLIPGVVDSTTNYVEHPELVAERIGRYAGAVGAGRVVAGVDCGFATIAWIRPMVHPTIVWEKLKSLVEGARLASSVTSH